MPLPSNVIADFCDTVIVEDKRPSESTLNGTTVKYDGKICVKIDGSDQITPVSSTSIVKENQRVKVLIKNHQATITGNMSDPSASSGTVSDIDQTVKDQGTKISEFDIVIADKVDVGQLNAANARIDNLVSENVTINGKLEANEASIDNLKVNKADISSLNAANAEIDKLKATQITAEQISAKYATITNLEATNATVNNLQANYGKFVDLTTTNFKATDAKIENLEAKKADIESLKTQYANIDFANIGDAAIRKLFSDYGLIKDLVISDGTITGELIGVTIRGDLIEGGTVVADKLIFKGENGLYYQLNHNGESVEAKQTDENSLNGSVIMAQSITASKISVKDLVAFGATIGGFHISDNALYSGVKESVDNTTRGIYENSDGEFALGDETNYLKFYNAGTESEPHYILDISASGMTFAALANEVDQTSSEQNVLQSNLEQLNAVFQSFVQAGTDSTLFQQTSDGFTFNFESLKTNISNNTNNLADIQSKLTSDEQELASVEEAVNAVDNRLQEQSSYIRFGTTSSGDPQIELGSINSPFKVRITNTSVDFMDSENRVAWISNNQLNITSATVSKELKVGDVNGSGYIWQKRSNNHLGLRYVTS